MSLSLLISRKPGKAWGDSPAHGRQGRAREAAELMQSVLPHLAPSPQNWLTAVYVWTFVGETEQASTCCDEMLRRFGGTENPRVAHSVVLANLMTTDRELTEQIDRLVALCVTRDKRGYWRDKGLLHYRREEYALAVKWIEKANQPGEWVYGRIFTLYYLAMARQELGDSDGARAALEEADGIREKLQAGFTDDDFGSRWRYWFGSEALRREAERAVRPEPTD